MLACAASRSSLLLRAQPAAAACVPSRTRPAACPGAASVTAATNKSPRQRRVSSAAAADGAVVADATSSAHRNVVVAVDASEDSLSAFQWVLKNLLKPEDELHLLHVVPDTFSSPASGSLYYVASPDPETERALWAQAQQFFTDTFVEQARQRGVVAPEAVQLHLVKESRSKSIGAAVCRKAEELRAEPLVVAAHDKGAIETLLTGSVSKHCVQHSKRPVLLLHPQYSNL